MRIVFLCGSLEPGRDGVGDYTRQLAGELIRLGHFVSAIALYDRHLVETQKEDQLSEGIKLAILRLPYKLNEKYRFQQAKEWIEGFEPELISLQFVPFSFHPLGFTHKLTSNLRLFKGKFHWHIMFHEPWVGGSSITSLKDRLWGIVQGIFIKMMVRTLKPTLVHTSNRYYQLILKRGGIPAKILPLSSNIPICGDTKKSLLGEFINLGIRPEARHLWCVLGVFGTVRQSVDFCPLLKEIKMEMAAQGRCLAFLSIGRTGKFAVKIFHEIAAEFKDEVLIHQFGERSFKDISAFLQMIDYGVSAVPDPLLGKSGAVSAMRLHGLKVLVPGDISPPELKADLTNGEDVLFGGFEQAFAPQTIAGRLITEFIQHKPVYV